MAVSNLYGFNSVNSDLLLSLLVTLSIISSIPVVSVYIYSFIYSDNNNNIPSSSDDDNNMTGGYTSISTNENQQNVNEKKVLYPRTTFFLQQTSIFSCTFFIIIDIISSCYIENNESCTDNFCSTTIFIVINVLSLMCDTLCKISKNWKIKILWIPTYTINVLYIITEGVVRSSNNGMLSSYYILAMIFSITGLIFSIIIVTQNTPIILKNNKTEEYTVGMISYFTFSYMNGIYRKGMSKISVEIEDIEGLMDRDTSEYIHKVCICIC